MNLWTKPRPPETNLAAKSQEKQELILKYSDIPFTSLLQKVSFKFQGQFKRSVLVLPCTLNKFLLEKSTDLQEFNAKWKEFREFSLCYTDQFQANPYLVKGPSNMKIYFQYLIHLNPENEYDFLARKGKLVLGGCFGVDKEQEVLLKIVFYGSGTVGLKAAAKAKEFKICEFLLKTLIFLLKKT